MRFSPDRERRDFRIRRAQRNAVPTKLGVAASICEVGRRRRLGLYERLCCPLSAEAGPKHKRADRSQVRSFNCQRVR
jgi:hypothetical protein